jgi:hypothetical protein
VSAPVDPSLRELDRCGGCEGVTAETPVAVTNRPGLAAVAYRAGTYSAFKRSLIAGLTDTERPQLRDLRTREDDDFSIALLDAWATVADVLTFYQERIANEAWLRTATERRSVLELARMIGYELHPGVAAGALLAFTLEDAVGAPPSTDVPEGCRVQSVPGPGERPQTFETIEPLAARVELNALRPQRTVALLPRFGDRDIYLEGTATGLRPGDGLLIVGGERRADPGSENWDFRRVAGVEPDADRQVTRVTWVAGLGRRLPGRRVFPAEQNPEAYALRLRTSLWGAAAPDWRTLDDKIRNRYLGGSGSESNKNDDWPNLTIPGVAFGADDRTGLAGEYFDDIALSEPLGARVDGPLNFTSFSFPGLRGTNFSVRWTGKVIPAHSGRYTFHVTTDDGARLWVGGQLIVDSWVDQAPTEHRGKIDLVAERSYEVRLEYYQRFGGTRLALEWSSAAQARQLVPKNRMRQPEVLHLSPQAPAVLPGSWLVLDGPVYTEVYEVTGAEESARQGFAISGKTTRVALRGENLDRFDEHLRAVAVHAQSERIGIAERPRRDPVEGTTIDLETLVEGLEKGRRLIVTGRRMRVRVEARVNPLVLTADDGFTSRALANGEELIVVARDAAAQSWRLRDAAGFEGTLTAAPARLTLVPSHPADPVFSEAAVLDFATGAATEWTVLHLVAPLAGPYDRATVAILANVAAATHGEAVQEVLGGGDAAKPFLTFRLRESPLTYTRADTPSGGESTLALRVDGVRWDEVPSLYARGPRERVYVARRQDDGKAVVEFGDGQEGARPATGTENVTASYRKGIGRDGNVGAGQLSLVITRPLGVRGVTNPLPAGGGQDPQELADARTNAPVTVLTLERVVSIKDFEDFALAYAGIGKALATWTWSEDRRGVFLTVAGPDGGAVVDDVLAALKRALVKSGDPHVPVRVATYADVPFRLAAAVEPDQAYATDALRAAVETALREHFSFARRAFGQPVALSEVMAVIQDVPGVVSVDVERLSRGAAAERKALLIASRPVAGAAMELAQPAELLTLDLRAGDIGVTQ